MLSLFEYSQLCSIVLSGIIQSQYSKTREEDVKRAIANVDTLLLAIKEKQQVSNKHINEENE